MKKLLHIATADNGTELNIEQDGDDIGIMVTASLDMEPFVVPDNPDWLEKKFGKETVEKAKQALDYLRLKYTEDDGKKLFESIAPDIMKVINDIKQEKDNQ